MRVPLLPRLSVVAHLVLVVGATALLGAGCDGEAEEIPPAVVSTITLGDGRVAGVGVDAGANRVYVARRASTGEPSLEVVDSRTEKRITGIPLSQGEFFNQIKANPNTGRVYAVDALSNTLFIIDGDSNSVVQTLHAKRGHGPGLAVNELTNLVYWVDGDISVVDGTTDAIVDTISMGLEAGVRSIALDQANNRLYASSDARGEIYAVDLGNKSIAGSVVVDGAFLVEVNPETNQVYVTNHSSNVITVIDGATMEIVGTIESTGVAPQEYAGPYIAVDPAANFVYVSNRLSGTVDVFNGDNYTVVTTITVGGEPTVMAVHTQTGRVYAANTAWGGDPWMQQLTYVSVIAAPD